MTDYVGWTEERVEKLKKDWKDGLSCSQIAARLGGITRNAVIGKVHRLKLTGRAVTVRIAKRKRSHAQQNRLHQDFNVHQAANKAMSIERALGIPRRRQFREYGNKTVRDLFKAEHFPVVEELVIPLHERQTIISVEAHQCKWPIGDPQNQDFHICGRDKLSGLPYCEHHARLAFQPPQVKRRDETQPTKQLETVS